jgi:hypothetical protein
MTTSIKFIVGRTYQCRSICDHNCIWQFKVVARTAKTVSLESDGKIERRGIREYDGEEICHPHGKYSMAPTLTASKVVR